uniref:Rapunzel 4 n=1 Tax=Neogobius melanostomus TaxID=47308 RepID=A0A8C6T483_9GOBI
MEVGRLSYTSSGRPVLVLCGCGRWAAPGADGSLDGVSSFSSSVLNPSLKMENSCATESLHRQLSSGDIKVYSSLQVRERLDEASEQMQRIKKQINKSFMDVTYSTVEENIINHFRKYAYKEEFLDHFDATGGDQNLHTLFSAVMGDFSRESVLKITMDYVEKDRRAVEEFCARLKQLFCVGLIALLGHAVLKDYGDEEQLLKEWGDKMAEVQKRMDAVIQECINSFPEQAEKDAQQVVKDNPGLGVEPLVDWVFWSVASSSLPPCCNGCAGHLAAPAAAIDKRVPLLNGKNRFLVPCSDEHLHVVVSYSSSPEPVDRGRVEQLMSGQKKRSVEATAELLFKELPGDCAVHTIKTREIVSLFTLVSANVHSGKIQCRM